MGPKDTSRTSRFLSLRMGGTRPFIYFHIILMCGIFSYAGDRTDAGELVLEGLRRLDYRGYDSWGVGVVSEGKIFVHKQVGKISEAGDIPDMPHGSSAVAHTRWATTGGVTQINAHPHTSTDGSFVLVQNGVVENFEVLRKELTDQGYSFVSETDTEVIVRLVEHEKRTYPEMSQAMRSAFMRLEGRNTIVILTRDGELYAARNGSPLVIGLAREGRGIFLSSDALSFASYADRMIVVDNGSMVKVSQGQIELRDIETQTMREPAIETLTLHADTITKEGYDHYMIKEIHETPHVIRAITSQDKHAVEELASALRSAHHIYVIGSGTAGIAAYQIAFYLRLYGGLQATSLIGADVRSYYALFRQDDIVIAPSQSGETADVIEVLEYVKSRGIKIASIVNMPGSIMTRMSDYPFMCGSGPEICVMSTKVFTAQISWGYLLAKTVQGAYEQGKEALHALSEATVRYLDNPVHHETLRSLARHLSTKEHIFLLGKYQNFAIVAEGMVKIVEGSYRHAHAIPAGDLKHYAITLIEKGVPVIVAVSDDLVKSDLVTAINEVRLRGAEVIAIAHSPQDNYDHYLATEDTGETDAISMILPVQLLAYYMAVYLGNNIDKPRNIAKSVTVK